MPTQKQKILEKAIEKAIDGGWKFKKYMFDYSYPNFKKTWTGDIILATHEKGRAESVNYIEILFNHDFAKALWGEPKASVSIAIGGSYVIPTEKPIQAGNFGWQYHLQQMVIADDPIKYLGANL